jgi:hypothetical protein
MCRQDQPSNAIGKSANDRGVRLGRKSTAELGSYRVLVVVNGGLGSGSD